MWQHVPQPKSGDLWSKFPGMGALLPNTALSGKEGSSRSQKLCWLLQDLLPHSLPGKTHLLESRHKWKSPGMSKEEHCWTQRVPEKVIAMPLSLAISQFILWASLLSILQQIQMLCNGSRTDTVEPEPEKIRAGPHNRASSFCWSGSTTLLLWQLQKSRYLWETRFLSSCKRARGVGTWVVPQAE